MPAAASIVCDRFRENAIVGYRRSFFVGSFGECRWSNEFPSEVAPGLDLSFTGTGAVCRRARLDEHETGHRGAHGDGQKQFPAASVVRRDRRVDSVLIWSHLSINVTGCPGLEAAKVSEDDGNTSHGNHAAAGIARLAGAQPDAAGHVSDIGFSNLLRHMVSDAAGVNAGGHSQGSGSCSVVAKK